VTAVDPPPADPAGETPAPAQPPRLTPAQRREAQRQRRRRRFGRPLDTPSLRLRAWWNALFVDHQIIRLLYRNRWRLGAKAWRSSQPAPADIRWFARRGGRTVVNLRGQSEFGSYALAREAIDAAGLTYRELKVHSRELPARETLLGLPAFFDGLEYPALFHCKSGADRAGLVSALYLLLHEDRPLAEARAQLGLKFGHVRQARTGVLDHMLDTYAAAHAANGVSFLDWVRADYDPAAIKASFRPPALYSFVVDRVLRRE